MIEEVASWKLQYNLSLAPSLGIHNIVQNIGLYNISYGFMIKIVMWMSYKEMYVHVQKRCIAKWWLNHRFARDSSWTRFPFPPMWMSTWYDIRVGLDNTTKGECTEATCHSFIRSCEQSEQNAHCPVLTWTADAQIQPPHWIKRKWLSMSYKTFLYEMIMCMSYWYVIQIVVSYYSTGKKKRPN